MRGKKVHLDRGGTLVNMVRFGGATALFAAGTWTFIEADDYSNMFYWVIAALLGSLGLTIHYIIQFLKTKPVFSINKEGFEFRERFIAWQHVEKVEFGRNVGSTNRSMNIYFKATYSKVPLLIGIADWKISDEKLSTLMNTAIREHRIQQQSQEEAPSLT